MIPVNQTLYGKPGGDCFTACLASIMEMRLEDLEGIRALYLEAAQRWEGAADDEERHWAWSRGWKKINLVLGRSGTRLAYVEALGGDPPACPPAGYAIAEGPGPRGIGHCVVVLDGRLAHDPHYSKLGLLGIENYVVLVKAAR